MVRSGIDNNIGDDNIIDLEKNNNNNNEGDFQSSLTCKPSLTSQTSDGLRQSNLPTIRDVDDKEHNDDGTNANSNSNDNETLDSSSSRKNKKETQQQQQQQQQQRDGNNSTRNKRRKEKPRRSKSPKQQQQRSRSPKSRSGVPSSAVSSSITPTTASISSSNNNKSSIASSTTSSSKDPTRKRVTIASEMKAISIESSSVPSSESNDNNNNNNIKNQPSSSTTSTKTTTTTTTTDKPPQDDRVSVVRLQLPSEIGPSLEPSSRPSTSAGGKKEEEGPKLAVPKRSTTFDPDGIISNHNQLRILLRTVTTSDSFLLAGGIIFTGFIVREIITFCQRDVVADVLYISGAACFFISGIIQLIIDLAWTRSIPIGRYSTSKFWNIVITVLFLTGVFIDMIAFAFWRTGEGDKVEIERTIQWISSHLWLLASIIAIIVNWGRPETIEDKLDTIGNGFFFCEAMMNSMARYLTDTDTEGLDSRELNLELAAAIFWTLNAFFYLCGDSFRLRRFNKESRIMSMV